MVTVPSAVLVAACYEAVLVLCSCKACERAGIGGWWLLRMHLQKLNAMKV